VAAAAARRRRRLSGGAVREDRARPLFPRAAVDDAGGGTGPAPDLSIVAFRYRPARGDIDAFNARLLQRLQEEGRVFLSGTRIDGADWLRCAILSFRTHVEHVDETIDVLTGLVAALEAE
jgi:aromatic-L-amino-acid decarboxylase